MRLWLQTEGRCDILEPEMETDMSKTKITEAMVKEIHNASDLSQYTHTQLSLADQWIKDKALTKLRFQMAGLPNTVKNYVFLMSRCHFGSVETDQFLTDMGCYPKWMNHA